MNDAFRAGFVALLGRPNVGKSTLLNAMVGRKVSIVSSQVETTRRALRGVVNAPGVQIILVDTPGVHRPRTVLGQRLNDTVGSVLTDADVLAVCFPADEASGPGDERILREVAKRPSAKSVAIVTKTDRVKPERLLARLAEIGQLYSWNDIVPVCAISGDQVDDVISTLGALLPLSPQLYPDDVLDEEPADEHIAELIREAIISDLHDEVPHSVMTQVDEMAKRGDGLTIVHASVYVERDSQKGILIGRGGARLKQVGARARQQIEQYLGTRVFLDVRVKVAKEWQSSPKLLDRFGF